MTKSIITIALFGANGQMGKPVFEALLHCKDAEFKIIVFVSPKSTFDVTDNGVASVIVERVDLETVNLDEIARILFDTGVDVVLCTLGGEIITKQKLVQDAAAKAGVKRFYTSDFGMPQVIWLPNEEAYLHPVWALKMKVLDDTIRHPAIKSGKMTYTSVGCTECYDAIDEPLFCPWLEKDEAFIKDGYCIQCVGDADAKMDYCSRIDMANFVVATLLHPERSENQILGFRSDHISFNEVARLLQKHSGKPAKTNVISIPQMQTYLKDPVSVPKELQRISTFPLDFFLTLRYLEGQGVFYRPPGMLNNDLFPEVKPISVDEYFERIFSKEATSNLK